MEKLYVVIRRNVEFERIHRIEGPETVIGRGDDCSLRLPDKRVSRNHALLLCRETEVVLRDLDSRNSTILHGRPIMHDEVIQHGDEVQIGPFGLTICFNLASAIRESGDPDGSTLSDRSPVVEDGPVEPDDLPLTPAQRRVYDLFLEGLIEKEVAARLGISINTVHHHAKAIYKTLSVSTRGELISQGLSAGQRLPPQGNTWGHS